MTEESWFCPECENSLEIEPSFGSGERLVDIKCSNSECKYETQRTIGK